jgi:hypothetical protein
MDNTYDETYRRPSKMNRKDIPVPNQFIKKFPDLKPEKVKKLHNKYLNSIRQHLFPILPHIDTDTCNFALKRVQDICGDFYYKNVRYYVWHEFFNVQPFFYIIKKGSNITGMTSTIKITNQKYIDLLIDTADVENLVKSFYNKFDTNERTIIPIDYDSLCSYISRTQFKLEKTSTDSALYNKLLQNLRTAKFFKLISEYFISEYGDYVIPHVKSNKTDYGRTYYKGINLQNCASEVRNAILGEHTVYDLNAAVYAVKLLLAENIYKEYGYDFTGQFTYTKEYIDHKTQIRNELATVLSQHMPNYPNPLKLVKEAMTAIGFGAKVHEGVWQENGSTQYSALHNIIYNKTARQQFVKHSFVKNFLIEQDMLSKIIYAYYSKDIDFCKKVKNIENMHNNGKLVKSKVLSYLYQQCETKIMDIATESIVPILRIHDSFIMNKSLNAEELIEIKFKLQQISKYLTLSHESHTPWIHQDILEQELLHKQRIVQETLDARNYNPKHSMIDNSITIPNKHKIIITKQNDNTCYDSFDDGSQHEEYDNNNDSVLPLLNYNQRIEHYRIMGIQQLPTNIEKLMR